MAEESFFVTALGVETAYLVDIPDDEDDIDDHQNEKDDRNDLDRKRRFSSHASNMQGRI